MRYSLAIKAENIAAPSYIFHTRMFKSWAY
jgi:hypothetical protein